MGEDERVSITAGASDARAVASVPFMPFRRSLIAVMTACVPIFVPGLHGWAAEATDVAMIPDADDDLAVNVFQVGRDFISIVV